MILQPAHEMRSLVCTFYCLENLYFYCLQEIVLLVLFAFIVIRVYDSLGGLWMTSIFVITVNIKTVVNVYPLFLLKKSFSKGVLKFEILVS